MKESLLCVEGGLCVCSGARKLLTMISGRPNRRLSSSMAVGYKSGLQENPAIASWSFLVVTVCKCVVFSATESGCLSIIVVKSPCHLFHFMGSPVKGSIFIFGRDIGNVETCGGFEKTVGCYEDDVFCWVSWFPNESGRCGNALVEGRLSWLVGWLWLEGFCICEGSTGSVCWLFSFSICLNFLTVSSILSCKSVKLLIKKSSVMSSVKWSRRYIVICSASAKWSFKVRCACWRSKLSAFSWNAVKIVLFRRRILAKT